MKHKLTQTEETILLKYGTMYYKEKERSISRHKIASAALKDLKNHDQRWNLENLNKWLYNNKRKFINPLGQEYYMPIHYLNLIDINKNMVASAGIHNCSTKSITRNDLISSSQNAPHINMQCTTRNDSIDASNINNMQFISDEVHVCYVKNLILIRELKNEVQILKQSNEYLRTENYRLKTKEIQRKQNIAPHTFAIAVITTGLTFSRASLFLQKLQIEHPSERTFYREQKKLDPLISQIVTKHLSEIRSTLKNGSTIAFDGSWAHPRLARQCIGAFINTFNGDIIDYFILFLKMKGNNNKGNFQGFPNQMESQILKRLAQNWIGDSRIAEIVEDTDNRSNKIFKDLNWKITRLVDANHQKKHFKALFKRFKSIYYLEKSLFSWFNACIYEKNNEEKINKWKNCLKHFSGDHSTCLHDDIKEKDEIVVKDSDKEDLNKFVLEAADMVAKVNDPKTKHTNWNESFHHFRLYFCPKLIAHKISFKIRNSISVLFWNLGPEAYIYLLKNLNIDISQGLKQQIMKKQESFVKLRKHRRTEEYRLKANNQRKKSRNKLKNPEHDGYITSDSESDDDDPFTLSISDGITDDQFNEINITELEEIFSNTDKNKDKPTSFSETRVVLPPISMETISFNIVPIKNCQNNCYLNSALQMLFKVSPLHKLLESISTQDSIVVALKEAFKCCRENRGINPTFLVAHVGSILKNNHQTNDQEDAGELIIKLFNHLSNLNIDIEQIFSYIELKSCKCFFCSTVNEIEENNNILILNLPITDKKISITELISYYCSPNWPTIDRYCNVCEKNTAQNYNNSIKAVNNYLLILINRFAKDIGKLKKILTEVKLERIITVANIQFSLVGVINHINIGTRNNIENGHYYNHILHEGSFYHVSDRETPTKVNFPDSSKEAYILLYKKVIFQHE